MINFILKIFGITFMRCGYCGHSSEEGFVIEGFGFRCKACTTHYCHENAQKVYGKLGDFYLVKSLWVKNESH